MNARKRVQTQKTHTSTKKSGLKLWNRLVDSSETTIVVKKQALIHDVNDQAHMYPTFCMQIGLIRA